MASISAADLPVILSGRLGFAAIPATDVHAAT